ncbi:MAG TPA: glycosyltransferase family 39 protein [Oculatellaceae cyanobacterium]
MINIDKSNKFTGLLALGLIWLMGAVCDRIWLTLDHSVPAWDQAEYLTGSLNYWQALQHPQWFSSDWWVSFWQLSTKVPPFTYIAAGIIQTIFGTGEDQATLVQLFFSAILLISIYGLGTQLFSIPVALWAAAICQLLPGLYKSRLDFLLDYPLTAIVTLCFCCLTIWKIASKFTSLPASGEKLGVGFSSRIINWLWAVAFGLSLGLAFMVKQTALFFLITPIIWVGIGIIIKRQWGRLAQLITALLLSLLVWGFWYRTNWLLILTGSKRATIDSALAEGDPALNTINAWVYYLKVLPYQVSWVLFLVPIVGFIIYNLVPRLNLGKIASRINVQDLSVDTTKKTNNSQLRWLLVFLLGAYILSSININKDDRYILPYLPVVSILLAYGLTFWSRRWGKHIRWGTLGLAVLLMFLNLFPVGGFLGNQLTQVLSPHFQHHAYLGAEFPHTEVIDEVINTEPYLRSNIGILPSTPIVNQHNFNYYGALENFQVYARQVGVQKKQVKQDARSLSWFITKTGAQGSVPKKAQSAIVNIIEKTPDFQLHKSWNLPDNTTLKLFHSSQPSIQVEPLAQVENKVNLDLVIVPQQAPPGKPLPVSYEWSGSWEQLQSGLVLLTWRNTKQPSTNNRQLSAQNSWLHDHGIGMGNLYPAVLAPQLSAKGFKVTENTAMLPPVNAVPGIYTLEATYLNRKTGETYPIPLPVVSLKIDPAAVATPAPELDLITQMRYLATGLPKGLKGLEPVFPEIGRINQYDPIQDYLAQAEQALTYRLQQQPQNLDWAYALALSNALQQDVKGAIASLQKVTQLDPKNPYAHAYLAVVYLYDWHPKYAQNALKPAIAINPNLPELQALKAAAALMQGNVLTAWHTFRQLRINN